MVDHREGKSTPPTLPRPEEALGRGGLYTEPGFFPQWDELLAACEEWAISQGWRFSSSALLQVRPESPNYRGQARALPMALEYGDRIRAMQCFTDEPLLSEFRRCQELVAQEAVHNSMVATCRALGLWQEGAPVDEDCAWQDCSQPLEVVSRRLQNHAAQVDAAGLTEKLSMRTRQASFVVEFGLEHGLPPLKDATSEATLTDFLERIKEWDGGHDNEMCAPSLAATSLGYLPGCSLQCTHSLTAPFTGWRAAHAGRPPLTALGALAQAQAPTGAGAIALTLALALAPSRAWSALTAPGLRWQRARARHGEPHVPLGRGAAIPARCRLRLVPAQPEGGHHRRRHLWRRARAPRCGRRRRGFGRREDGAKTVSACPSGERVMRMLSMWLMSLSPRAQTFRAACCVGCLKALREVSQTT